MTLFQKFRLQTKIGLLLSVLIVCLFLNNMVNQANYENIEKAATSIYDDRLLPVTYIFDIRENLYKRNTLGFVQPGSGEAQIADQYNAEIYSLISKYEHTVLTAQERLDLETLKSNTTSFLSNIACSDVQNIHFLHSLESLNNLIEIQSIEGKDLKTDMVNIARGSLLLSYLEAGLLIIIGAITLSIIGFSKNIINQNIQSNPSLN